MILCISKVLVIVFPLSFLISFILILFFSWWVSPKICQYSRSSLKKITVCYYYWLSKCIDHRALKQMISIFTWAVFCTHNNWLENHKLNSQVIKGTSASITATGSKLSLPFSIFLWETIFIHIVEEYRSPVQRIWC